GEILLGVHLLGQGLDFVLSKLLVHFLYHLLLLGQSKIHNATSYVIEAAGAAARPALLKQSPPAAGSHAGSRRNLYPCVTAGPPGSWCGQRCRRRSRGRTCSPDGRRGPSCAAAGR